MNCTNKDFKEVANSKHFRVFTCKPSSPHGLTREVEVVHIQLRGDNAPSVTVTFNINFRPMVQVEVDDVLTVEGK